MDVWRGTTLSLWTPTATNDLRSSVAGAGVADTELPLELFGYFLHSAAWAYFFCSAVNLFAFLLGDGVH
jgi:hypothetical protein